MPARAARRAAAPLERPRSALGCLGEVVERLQEARPFFFLDYDGTLTPIVEHPADAHMTASMRGSLVRLAARFPVAVVSGRRLDDVRTRVGVPGILYAGEHGLVVAGPAGDAFAPGVDERHVVALRRLSGVLRSFVEAHPGAWVEEKRCTLAVHTRNVPAARKEDVAEAVRRMVAAEPFLRLARGKEVLEARPAVDWDKGKAVLRFMAQGSARGDRFVPVVMGDDRTDEDAFRAVAGSGVAVRVDAGSAATHAEFVLPGPVEVEWFLAGIVARMP